MDCKSIIKIIGMGAAIIGGICTAGVKGIEMAETINENKATEKAEESGNGEA